MSEWEKYGPLRDRFNGVCRPGCLGCKVLAYLCAKLLLFRKAPPIHRAIMVGVEDFRPKAYIATARKLTAEGHRIKRGPNFPEQP